MFLLFLSTLMKSMVMKLSWRLPFRNGMRIGFNMRQQAIAAIHAKVLRLNSASIVHANSGQVVNLVSNDVRRFDDLMPFWLFIWASPIELAMVLLLVSLELGILPALAGISSMLMVIPLQVRRHYNPRSTLRPAHSTWLKSPI